MAFLSGFIDYARVYNKAVADEMLLQAKEEIFWNESKESFLGINKRPLFEDDKIAVWVEGKIVNINNAKDVASLFMDKKEECFKYFDGSFILIILDKYGDFLYIVRDKAGIEPFYYFKTQNRFIFSSSLKKFYSYPFFKKEIDLDSLALFLQYGYIAHPYSIYKNTFKLSPASYLKIDFRKKNFQEFSYWNILKFYNEKIDMDENEIIDKSEELLFKAVEKRFSLSLSPKGSFLSGGYDSAAISLILSRISSKKIATYTIGFYEKGYDEAPFAKKIADIIASDHHEFYFSCDDAKTVMDSVAEIYNEPFGDKAALPTIFLSKKASKDIKEIFSGEGGDEVFATAGDMKLFLKLNKIPFFLRKTVSSLMKEVPLSVIEKFSFTNFSTRYEKWSNLLGKKDIVNFIKFKEQVMGISEIQKLFLKNISFKEPYFKEKGFEQIVEKENFLDAMLGVYFNIYMSNDELVKVSQALTYFNIRLYEPFLDKKLIEFLAQVPVSLKQKYSVEKYILKKIVHKYIPQEIMNRPKKGFSVPLDRWLRKGLSFYIETYLGRERIEREEIFDFYEVERIKKEFFSGKNEYTKRIWLLLMFEMWYERQSAL